MLPRPATLNDCARIKRGGSSKEHVDALCELILGHCEPSPWSNVLEPADERVVREHGPDHEKVFEVEVLIGSDVFARSSGRSKKEAEQSAARETLSILATNRAL